MKINIITIFPEFFTSGLQTSLMARAQKAGAVKFEFLQLRDFADGKNKKIVDDKPFGGGPGMVMKIEPIARALKFLENKGEKGEVILTSAQGEIFNQRIAQKWANEEKKLKEKLEEKTGDNEKILTLMCGHYEGVDERVKNLIDREISLGEFILTGGEPATLVMIDATVRLLDGVLGNAESLVEESFCLTGTDKNGEKKLEYPQYTQPREYQGWQVPEILLSGDHAKIAQWRADNCR